MTLLLNTNDLSKSHGSKHLFSEISISIFKGDKIGLIGPNGSGKSTLLKILCGIEKEDHGTLSCKKSLRIGYVPQSSEYPELSVHEVVIQALIEAHPSTSPTEIEIEASILLSKIGFKDHDQKANLLSGGWKKRLDIAKQLINEPDLLLLDEPTNHLDLSGILWLESFLKNEPLTFVVTSHDRYFLDNVATKMMELNSIYPQGLLSSDGNYSDFVEKRESFLDYQEQCEKSLATKVRSETHWLRQSPKARTTKAQARVQSAGRLIDELSAVRNRNKQPKAKIDFESTDRQTRKLLSAKNLSISLGGRLLFEHLDLTLTPGMRLGIAGSNGSGKTTLLKMLADEITPDKGLIKYAEGVRIVYFDQHRQLVNPNDTLREALSPNSDTVIYRDQPIHVNSWGKRFLFGADRMDLPVKQLSGGERARIGIARLMLQPADILLLDEPTNDLDIPTLENLEEALSDFPGAIVVITHDRALLDRLTNCIIGLGATEKPPILADLNQWEEFVKSQTKEVKEPPKIRSENPIKEQSREPLKKLSYQEKKELEGMEKNIIAIEEIIDSLSKEVEKQTTSNNSSELKKTCEALDEAHKKLESLFNRWEELQNKAN